VLEHAQSNDSQDVVISCTIAKELSVQQGILIFATSRNLHLMLTLSWLDSSLIQHIQPASLPLNCQWTVTDPALLHLIQLLQTEIHNPKPMSQPLIGSIVTVLATHLLRCWQTEPCQTELCQTEPCKR
jgi:hypothetical protein